MELKRCPFCGGKAELVPQFIGNDPDRKWYFVRCTKCFTNTDTFGNQRGAVQRWNNRVSD